MDKIIFQAEEMTQLWKYMFCKYENLSSATQGPCQSQVWYYHPFNLGAWGKRQEDPWGLMASEAPQITESRFSENLPQKGGFGLGEQERKEHWHKQKCQQVNGSTNCGAIHTTE